MLCASEGDCTSATVIGQFSIFGAVEENLCHGFSRIFRDHEPSERYRGKARGGRGLELREEAGGKSRSRSNSGLCTELAQEMQKGGGDFGISFQLRIFSENQVRRRCSNSSGAVLIAPQ